MYKPGFLVYDGTTNDEGTTMIENATVEDLQHELQVMIQESIEDLGLEDVDEGSIAADMFGSMTYNYDYDTELLAEVARRELGYVPVSARPAVSDAFEKLMGLD